MLKSSQFFYHVFPLFICSETTPHPLFPRMADISRSEEKYTSNEKDLPVYDVSDGEGSVGVLVENADDLKRRLTGRQIQMITIGGSIGTALFVSIGSGLVQGGPGSLLIAFMVYCVWLAAVNNCMAEMTVSAFLRRIFCSDMVESL
jgi:amino acid permease